MKKYAIIILGISFLFVSCATNNAKLPSNSVEPDAVSGKIPAIVGSAKGQDAALLNAIKQNDLSEVQSALRNGANPNQLFQDGGVAKSALLFAVERGNLNIVKALLGETKGEKSDPNVTDGTTPTPLMAAILIKNIDIIDALIKAGTNVNAQLRNGNTALHYTISGGDFHRFSQGDPNIVTLILKNGGNINQKGQNGDTPAMMAIKSNSVDIMNRILSDPGADIGLVNNAGLNALSFILETGLTSNINQVMFSRILNKIPSSQIVEFAENTAEGKNYLIELANDKNHAKDSIIRMVCAKDMDLASRTTQALDYVGEPFLLIGIRKGWSYEIIQTMVDNYPNWQRLRAGRKTALDYISDYRRTDLYSGIFR
ncbi:hypothetical protein AGMMS50268_05510 [Spirochaetia bacterium]|nr:hypothetical protein AGMMS50268_05510 [Spirochaetia bacterium]